MKEFHIKTQKTARCFSIGSLNASIKYVWIVLHGYGYHAKYFLKKFEPLTSPNTYIVAPEGLSRFYKDGLTGKVGASWMTKEDRLSEIEDSIIYLDKLYDQIFGSIDRTQVQLITLGFSQGGATLLRWLNNRKANTNHLALWGSKIPDDFDFEKDKDLFEISQNYLMIGKSDQYLSYINIDEYMTILKKSGIYFKLNWYEGGHNILPQPLIKLQKLIN